MSWGGGVYHAAENRVETRRVVAAACCLRLWLFDRSLACGGLARGRPWLGRRGRRAALSAGMDQTARGHLGGREKLAGRARSVQPRTYGSAAAITIKCGAAGREIDHVSCRAARGADSIARYCRSTRDEHCRFSAAAIGRRSSQSLASTRCKPCGLCSRRCADCQHQDPATSDAGSGAHVAGGRSRVAKHGL